MAESVYWPEIPASAVTAATALRTTIGDAVKGPAYLRLLTTGRPGKVGIRHSPGVWEKAFVAAATFDAPDENRDFIKTLHFDAMANQVVLPFEAGDAWGPTPANSPKRQ